MPGSRFTSLTVRFLRIRFGRTSAPRTASFSSSSLTSRATRPISFRPVRPSDIPLSARLTTTPIEPPSLRVQSTCSSCLFRHRQLKPRFQSHLRQHGYGPFFRGRATVRHRGPSRPRSSRLGPRLWSNCSAPDLRQGGARAWFRIADANFGIRRVTDPVTKYYYVLSKLDSEKLRKLSAFLDRPSGPTRTRTFARSSARRLSPPSRRNWMLFSPPTTPAMYALPSSALNFSAFSPTLRPTTCSNASSCARSSRRSSLRSRTASQQISRRLWQQQTAPGRQPRLPTQPGRQRFWQFPDPPPRLLEAADVAAEAAVAVVNTGPAIQIESRAWPSAIFTGNSVTPHENEFRMFAMERKSPSRRPSMAKIPSSAWLRKTSRSVAERGRTTSTPFATSPARPHRRRHLAPSLPTGHGVASLSLASLHIVPLPAYISLATHSRQRYPNYSFRTITKKNKARWQNCTRLCLLLLRYRDRFWGWTSSRRSK